MLNGVDLQELDSIGYTGVGFYWIYRRWILLDLQELESIGSAGVGFYWIYRSWNLLDLQELGAIQVGFRYRLL